MNATCSLAAAAGTLARLYPWRVEPGDDLRLAIGFLGWETTAATVVRAGYGAGLLVGGVGVVAAGVVPAPLRLAATLGAVAVGLFAVHAIHATPRLLATIRRTNALGAGPDLVARVVLRMRLAPSPERAAGFAARSGEGILADSLARHVREARNTPRSGLAAFVEEWAELFPSFRRAFALVEAAGAAPETDRDRLLDRALAAVLEGTREEMEAFAAGIRPSVTALYAFGVLLPTALVALLPAAGAAGIGATLLPVALVYDLLLPGTLVVVSVRLLVRRPVAFPPPDVTRDHPDVPDRTRVALLGGCGTAALTWLVAAHFFPSWGPPIAALGFGTGVGLLVAFRPVIAVHERVRRIEAGLPDALALLGRQVANGRAVETAIDRASDELHGEIGDVLATGATRQRQVGVGVREAFLGRHGVLEAVPSPRLRGSLAVLGLAATEGRPAGTALVALGDHLETLRDIERESRHSLAYVCRTLRSTGAVFGPMVGGATVALADGIGGGSALGGEPMYWLGGTVGWYVLLLAVVLTALATGLTRGLDRSLVGYRVGAALVSATAVFLGAYLLVGRVA